MKKIYLAACAAMMTFTVNAENVENEINSTSEAQASENYDAENGVVTIGSDRMFQIESKDGKFSFKPYLMIQSTANFHYYDDEGLDKAYNQDNVANSGFAMPYAVLGFTGKAFSNITYNLSINAAASGANILQQAWFDVKVSDGFAVKVGKFKTPFSSAYLTTLGENGVMLLNAVGVISPTIIYGPEWCDAAFATLAGVTSFNANECPDLRVEHVIIKSNQRMTGSATLNKTNPNNPYIEMDGGQWMPTGQLDQVICHVTNPQSLIPTAGEQAVLNIIGNLPIAPNVWQPTYQMDIYFQVNINGTTYYYMFETQTSQHNFATARSLRDWLAVNFQTVGNTLPTPNADGSITFGNGTLSAPSLVNLWN